MTLVSHVISQDQVIKGHVNLWVGVRHSGTGDVFSLSCDPARPHDQRVMQRYE